MKKTRSALVLTCALLALGTAACGEKKTKTVETTETVANRESQQAEETKEAAKTKLETPEQLPVSLVVRNSGRELVNLEPNGMGIEEKHYSYPDWTEVPTLPVAASEGLHEAMKRYEEEQTAALKKFAETHRNDSEQDYPVMYAGDVTICRSDSNFFSFVRGVNSFTTDAEGYSYDSRTGEVLTLSQVVKDMSQLQAAVDEVLKENAKSDLSAIAKEALEKDAIVWALGNEGLDLFIAQSDGYYVDYQRIVISYERYPELFSEGVKLRPAVYAAQLMTTAKSYIDGKVVQVKAPETEGGSFTVMVDDKRFTVEKPEMAGGLISLLYVKTASGTYLYPEFQGDYSDASYLLPVDLQSGKASKLPEDRELGMGFDLQNAVNPDALALSVRSDTLSTLYTFYPVKIGSDGVPEAIGERHYFTGVTVLHSKQALTLSLVKDGKETGEKTEVPADSNYFFYAGDNKSYVDFRLEDGREVRVHIKGYPEDVWVEGSVWIVEEQYKDIDLFTGMRYAG
jgi:lipoprotein